MQGIVRILLCAVLGLASVGTRAERITVAVASNFAAPMTDIAAAFERQSGHEVQLAFGSSGKLFAQISHGAPFEVFFSADRDKPEALERKGLAVESSRFTYAVGVLALWSARTDVPVENAEVLRQGDFNKLALANPRLAPYGAAAVDVLESLGLAEATRPRWVQGENIAQTYQFVGSGNAAVGFVALSQIMVEGIVRAGSAWIVPEPLHAPIRQDAVLLRRGASNEAARAFLAFVRSDAARAIIESYGYRGGEPT